MRDPVRQRPLIEKLYRVWASFPDWRLGQLIFNVTGVYDSFHVEDDELEQQLDLVLSGGHPTVTLP